MDDKRPISDTLCLVCANKCNYVASVGNVIHCFCSEEHGKKFFTNAHIGVQDSSSSSEDEESSSSGDNIEDPYIGGIFDGGKTKKFTKEEKNQWGAKLPNGVPTDKLATYSFSKLHMGPEPSWKTTLSYGQTANAITKVFQKKIKGAKKDIYEEYPLPIRVYQRTRDGDVTGVYLDPKVKLGNGAFLRVHNQTLSFGGSTNELFKLKEPFELFPGQPFPFVAILTDDKGKNVNIWFFKTNPSEEEKVGNFFT